MKIAWVTPFFRDSAVGELGGRVAAEMAAAGHGVTIFGCGRPPYVPTALPFVPVGEYDRISAETLAPFDAVVYNAANHPSSFPVYASLEHTPGIVVLCDRVYVHGLDAYTQLYLRRPSHLETLAQELYGSEGVAFVRRFRGGNANTEDFERFPFIEPLLANARAALVHSREYQELVQARWNGKVGRLQGFTVPPRPTKAPAPRDALQIQPDDFVLAFVGYISPYRGLETLFEVLRKRSDLAARMKIAIVGRIEDQHFAQRLQQLAADCGLAARMRWGFNSTDDVKHAVLSNADAAYNCRTLNSEGSSASLIEEMSYGLPVIVNANGFARDIPEDAVCFVDRERMAEGIERSLEMLVSGADRRRGIGARARAWVDENSSTRTYAETILALAEETMPRAHAAPSRPQAAPLPLVSIAIPSYNYAKYIARAVRSATAQTYPNIEIVISDNASTDNSLEVIAALAAQDSRIRYSVNERNVGATENYRIVREACKGEYIVFLSADDVMYPNHVNSAIEYYLTHPECDIRHTGFTIIGENGEPLWVFDHPGFRGMRSVSARDEFGYAMAADGHVMLQTIVFPRRVMDAIGDFATHLVSEDTDYLFRCNRAGYRFAFDATPSIGFMQHAGSVSSPENFIATGNELHAWLTLYDENIVPETLARCVGRRRRIGGVVDNAVRRLHEYAKDRAPQILEEHADVLERVRRKIASIPDRLDAAASVAPRFSIVLPTIGAIGILKRSIDAVLSQTISSWELIVVSNGGANLESIVRTWVEPDRLVWARTMETGNPASARNLALSIARGETIAYLDEGDVWSPHFLAAVESVLDQHGADVVRLGAAATYYALGEQRPGAAIARDTALYAPAGASYVDGLGLRSPLSAIAHRAYCREITGAFNENLAQLEDWEFVLRLTAHPEFKKVDVGDTMVDAAFYQGLAFQSLGRRLQTLPAAFHAVHAMHPSLGPDAAARTQHVNEVVGAANALIADGGSIAALQSLIRSVYGYRGRRPS